jgi:hypothetical protein
VNPKKTPVEVAFIAYVFQGINLKPPKKYRPEKNIAKIVQSRHASHAMHPEIRLADNAINSNLGIDCVLAPTFTLWSSIHAAFYTEFDLTPITPQTSYFPKPEAT